MAKTVNQQIMPKTAKINKKGHLEIGGCDVVELADKFDTPLYIYDEQTIRQICHEYRQAFSSYKNTNLMFAAKAFMTKALCVIMKEENFGLDVVSGGEIYTAYKSGFDMSKVLFNGNNKSIEELELAIEVGVGRFSVDNFLELSLLDNLAKAKNTTVAVLLRITPGIECHTHEYIQTGHLDSKFGFDLTQLDETIELLNEQYGNLSLKGLHAHLGSQIFETRVYYDAVKVIFEQLADIKDKYNIKLTEINIGGGLGITYTESDNPPSVNEIAETIIKSIDEYSEKYGIDKPKIYLEPGRSIVGTSGVTIYTAGSSKQVPEGRKYVAVDGGMADNPRPSMYQAVYHAIIANKANETPVETVTIAGRFCESGDILIKDIELPLIEPGDIIAVFNTGAYGYSMSSNYNRVMKSGAVLVQNSTADVIIKRETYGDLIAHDVMPERMLCKL